MYVLYGRVLSGEVGRNLAGALRNKTIFVAANFSSLTKTSELLNYSHQTSSNPPGKSFPSAIQAIGSTISTPAHSHLSVPGLPAADAVVQSQVRLWM